MEWTADREKLLREMYGAGESFPYIAEMIGCTRNAVIGKVHRLNLPLRGPPRAGFIPKPRPQTIVRAKRVRKRKPPQPLPEPEPVIAPIQIGPVDIFGLTDTTCRYPLWATNVEHLDRLYCGVPTANLYGGKPYCPEHTLVAAGKQYGGK